MSKVLIDRALLERVQERLDPHRDAVLWGDVCDTFRSAPSGTPAMPVKAYYHEWTDLEGVRTRSVGLEVRKEFTDAPLVLEADALARIACLEGEIAKRDARIAELEADLTGTQSRVLSLQNQWRKLDAELAAIKAQEPVAEFFALDDDIGTIMAAWADGFEPVVGQMIYAAPVSEANEQGEYGDAYQGAREDLAIWKRRALEAEKALQEERIITERLGNALNEENGPTFMGEPVLPTKAQEPVLDAPYGGILRIETGVCGKPDNWVRINPCKLYAAPVSEAKAQGVIDFVFSGELPNATFVEVEDGNGNSINVGEWFKRDDGYSVLRLNAAPVQQVSVQDERAAFEDWYLNHFYLGDKQCGLEWLSTEPCGGYRHQHPTEQWLVWQARAMLAAPVQQVSVPDGWKLVKVGVDGVQFGNAWFSHEGITGYTADQLNSGNCRITGRAYMDWLNAASAAPAADAGLVEAFTTATNRLDRIALELTGHWANEATDVIAVSRAALAANSAKGVV